MKGAGQWRFLMVGGPHHGRWMTFNRWQLEDMYERGYYFVPDPQPLTYERYEDTFDVPRMTTYVLRGYDVVSADPANRGAYIQVLVAQTGDYHDGWTVKDALNMSLPDLPVHWGGTP